MTTGDHNDLDFLKRFFAALSDETRLRVAAAVVETPRSVGDIAAVLDLKDGVVQKHLAQLVQTEIVSRDTDGRYVLNVDGLRMQRKQLLARSPVPSPADEPGTPEWERTVFATFFDGERLKDIPVNMKKRLVVLAWLARQFQPDQRYHEREVNEIIKRYHPDAAALRRELVDQRFMARDAGVYWRLPEGVTR
jgi:DNA-binding transcriptional ArsR family regulator